LILRTSEPVHSAFTQPRPLAYARPSGLHTLAHALLPYFRPIKRMTYEA